MLHSSRSFCAALKSGAQPLASDRPVENTLELVALIRERQMISAVLPGWKVQQFGTLTALCRRLPVGKVAPPNLPPAILQESGVLLLPRPLPFVDAYALQVRLAGAAGQLHDALDAFATCHEIRLMVSADPKPNGDALAADKSQEQARILAKIAQGLHDPAQRVTITPDQLRMPAAGEQVMALSLLVQASRLADVEDAITLAQRLAAAHALSLQATAPGPIQSFLPMV